MALPSHFLLPAWAYVDVDVDVGSVQNLDLAGDYLGHEQKAADGSNAH